MEFLVILPRSGKSLLALKAPTRALVELSVEFLSPVIKHSQKPWFSRGFIPYNGGVINTKGMGFFSSVVQCCTHRNRSEIKMIKWGIESDRLKNLPAPKQPKTFDQHLGQTVARKHVTWMGHVACLIVYLYLPGASLADQDKKMSSDVLHVFTRVAKLVPCTCSLSCELIYTAMK